VRIYLSETWVIWPASEGFEARFAPTGSDDAVRLANSADA
jgi:hypothetical protein